MNRTTLLLLLTVVTFSMIQAQTPTIQDCLGAIPICQQIYTEEQSPSGTGNYFEISGGGTCATSETNSIWYTFTTNQSGQFGFVITPNNATDDYDWWMFDITDTGCAGINDNPVTSSCNVAGGGSCDGITGADGSSSHMMQGPGCNASNPGPNAGQTPFNDLVMVEQGNTYVLCISNWTGSPFGYTIDFGLSGDIGILDEIIPEVDEVISPTTCGESLIEVTFSENIQCPTVANSNFQLDGPGGPYSLTVSSQNCELGGEYDRTFILTIDPPIQSLGTFTLNMITDSSTEVLDLCGNPANSNNFVFTVSEPLSFIPVEIGNDTALLCQGDILVLDASFETATYEWQDGSTESTYDVTTSGIYSVSVMTACGTGFDTIDVTYLNDVPQVELGNDTILCQNQSLVLNAENDFGTYTWQDGTDNALYLLNSSGTYSVTVTNACGTAIDDIEVTYIDDFNLNLGPDQNLCEGETLTLNPNLSNVDLLWQDGSTNTTFTVAEAGTYAVTATTPCSSVTDSIEVTYSLFPVVDLGQDTVFCEGDSLIFDAFDLGSTYTWQDGSTEPTFLVQETGTYAVTVTNACGEVTDAQMTTVVPAIDLDLGMDTVLCPGESFFLNAFSPAADSYVWEDNTLKAERTVVGPGLYYVFVSSVCETIRDEIFIRECEKCLAYFPNAFSPNNDGVNDTFRPFSNCDLNSFQLQIFDRWGSLVFESFDENEAWDGLIDDELAATGVYVWVMNFVVVEDFKERIVEERGDVVLMR